MAIRFEPKLPEKPAKTPVVVQPQVVPPPAPVPELPLGESRKPAAKGRRKRT